MGQAIHTMAEPGIGPVDAEHSAGDKSLVILQSLICLLREKNLLSRADVEELSAKVAIRAADHAHDPLPCCTDGAMAAASEMNRLNDYIGRRYGGKHRRV